MATTSFEYFLGRRNAACVQLLERNHDMGAFIQGLLEHVVQYAEREGIAVEDVKLDLPFVSDDGYIQGRITR